jgi:exopolyphosphatase / guanosine-5'-triphosphate,3'-diphosphate pyrophosphatase
MTRVAAIDCGTNSIRLLIADLDGPVGRDVVREMRIVRLGEDLDRTAMLAPQALARTFAACEAYAELIEQHGAERLRFCATSAARDAGNAGEFTAGVRTRLGVDPEIVSGDEEARLSYAGAVLDLGAEDPFRNLVVDIGGGSTEFVAGVGPDATEWASVDVGSVRLTERHLHADPPTADEIARASRDIDRALDSLSMDLRVGGIRRVGDSWDVGGNLVGVAGSITTIAAHTLGLSEYDSERIHLSRLAVDDVLASCDALIQAQVAERRAMPFMHPGRADVIGGGALVLQRVLVRVAPALPEPYLLVSEHDILDGIAWSLR